ncbi:replication initiator protein A [Deinococcus hopiensis]|uniref:Plasmid replication initiator protein n=1 Tax=Deinococcus hopiensis KR-140 TaxID=695939 RepID=A0A1W1UMN1_9DEIO|nr:replication initiator protein A [Deinococcus hopiensis]SMB82061.1 Plasmid replication initiator protein [Deinococcus hopiensis KR-140]
MNGPADQNVVLREDLNVAQLGLISIQRKIAPDYTSWKVAFERSGIASEVECNGAQKYGVPHGIDNDSYLALQELYIEQGCPENGVLVFTIYRLLQMCGLEDSGANRRMLRESLERLSATQYWISGAWRSHEDDDWVTVGFRLIEKLVFTRSRKDVDGAKLIAVTLPQELTRNIRNGYFKFVSTSLLRQLGQPARAAYRVLDALRHDPVQHQARTVSLQIPLMDLAQRCGIATDKPDKIRRTLDPIHEDLLHSEYLKDVEVTGRGKRQVVTYTFGQASAEADPELVALLVAMKVPVVAAKKTALDHPQHVRIGVEQARAILARGYRPQNEVGFVLDVVRSYGSGKYAWPEGTDSPEEIPKKLPRKAAAPAPQEDVPASKEDLVRTLAFLLKAEGVRREEITSLPEGILKDIHQRVLGRPKEEREQAVSLLKSLLSLN